MTSAAVKSVQNKNNIRKERVCRTSDHYTDLIKRKEGKVGTGINNKPEEKCPWS